MDNIVIYLLGTILSVIDAKLFISSNGPLHLRSIINFRQGFSFKFRTCTSGTLLFQGNKTSFFHVQLTPTNSSAFSSLIFSWRVDSDMENVTLQSHYAFDRNDLLEVKLITADIENPVIGITGTININKTILNASFTQSMVISGPLHLGFDGFTGCLYSGMGVNLSTAMNSSIYQQNCPLDDKYPCDVKSRSTFLSYLLFLGKGFALYKEVTNYP